jgi:hypothetical protein
VKFQMDINTFIQLYKGFLSESEKKGWIIEILVEEFGDYLASIKNTDNIEVKFFVKLDIENNVQLSKKTMQSKLNYGVIRQKEKGDIFAKEVLEAFHQYWAKRSSKRNSIHFFYKP